MADTQTIFTSSRPKGEVQVVLDAWNAAAVKAGQNMRVSARTLQRAQGGPTNTRLYLVMSDGNRASLSLGNDEPHTVRAAIAHLLQSHGLTDPRPD